jgi:nucleotide-binding universal stress UspA family protein
MFKHILVATDLSLAARHAYRHAVVLAKSFDSRVRLIHVDETPTMGFHSSKELIVVLEAMEQRIAKRLEEEVAILSGLGLSVTVETRAGAASQELLKAIDETDIDLLVMTKHGSLAGHRLLLGSTSKRVVRHINVPLLSIAGEDAEPPEELPSYDCLLTATDFSVDSARGVRASLELAQVLEAKVKLLHVLRQPLQLAMLPGEPPLVIPRRSIDDVQAAQSEELARFAKEVGSGELEPITEFGTNAAETIVDVARAQDADLIAIPSHGSGGIRAVLFGSTSEHVIKHSQLPVLLLPRVYLEGLEEALESQHGDPGQAGHPHDQ